MLGLIGLLFGTSMSAAKAAVGAIHAVTTATGGHTMAAVAHQVSSSVAFAPGPVVAKATGDVMGTIVDLIV